MHLLPPSQKPFGVFAESSVVPLAQWELDLRIAKDLEREILTAYWDDLIERMTEKYRAQDAFLYMPQRYTIEYISMDIELTDGPTFTHDTV